MPDNKIHEWSAHGLVLSAADNRILDADNLFAFASRAVTEFKGCPVQVSEHGTLRVTRYDDQDAGPYLDWRD